VEQLARQHLGVRAQALRRRDGLLTVMRSPLASVTTAPAPGTKDRTRGTEVKAGGPTLRWPCWGRRSGAAATAVYEFTPSYRSCYGARVYYFRVRNRCRSCEVRSGGSMIVLYRWCEAARHEYDDSYPALVASPARVKSRYMLTWSRLDFRPSYFDPLFRNAPPSNIPDLRWEGRFFTGY
jgi:hypothetical protein